MTTQQLHLFNGLALVLLVVVSILTRATARRIAGGFAPVLAISATYVLFLLVGQWVMRLVAGPAWGSPLARRPWEAAAPAAATDPAQKT